MGAMSLDAVARTTQLARPTAERGPERSGEAPMTAVAASEALFRAEAPRLHRFLTKRTKTPEDASDLLQEAFVRLLKRPSSDPLANPAAYLQRIVRNLLRDRSKRASAKIQYLHDSLDAHVLADPGANPEAVLAARELACRYQAALSELGSKTQTVFLLHRQDELTYAQIAARTGLSVSGVEKHMMKAIAHFDRRLGQRQWT
jgi:RNA polymerase sigma-70 factor (ECF subfamily)